MIKVGKWIAKHKILIIIIGIALLIPSYLGMAATRINYDVLSYLPDTLETALLAGAAVQDDGAAFSGLGQIVLQADGGGHGPRAQQIVAAAVAAAALHWSPP